MDIIFERRYPRPKPATKAARLEIQDQALRDYKAGGARWPAEAMLSTKLERKRVLVTGYVD